MESHPHLTSPGTELPEVHTLMDRENGRDHVAGRGEYAAHHLVLERAGKEFR